MFYRADATRFLASLPDGKTSNDIELTLNKVSQENLQRFFSELIASGRYRPSTIRRMTVGIRHLFRFCCEQGWVVINPFDGLRLDLPELSPAEWVLPPSGFFEQLRELVRRGSPIRLPSRDLLILELMRLGMGSSVLAKLTVSDIGQVGDHLCWGQKSDRRRRLVLPEETRPLLQQYLGERIALVRYYCQEHDQLFVRWYAKPLSGRQMRRQLGRLARELGLAIDVRQISCMARRNGRITEGVAVTASA